MQNRLWPQQLCDQQAEVCEPVILLSTQMPSKSDVSWKLSSGGYMFVGRIVVLASGTGHTSVRWCHRERMPAPTCTQFAFKREYWAGQYLFLPFLQSLFTILRTFLFSPVFYLFPSLFPLLLLLLPLSSHPLLIRVFPLSSFSQRIRFPVSSEFYT